MRLKKKKNPSKAEHDLMLSKVYTKAFNSCTDEKEKEYLRLAKMEDNTRELFKIFSKLKCENSKIYIAYKVATLIDNPLISSNPIVEKGSPLERELIKYESIIEEKLGPYLDALGDKILPYLNSTSDDLRKKTLEILNEDHNKRSNPAKKSSKNKKVKKGSKLDKELEGLESLFDDEDDSDIDHDLLNQYEEILNFNENVLSNPKRVKLPLREGNSKSIISANIRDLFTAGYPFREAVKIALDQAGISTKISDYSFDGKKVVKTKKNPRIANISEVMNEVYKNIINHYKLLINAKTDPDKESISNSVIWLQAFFFDWYDNMILTMRVFHELFDLKKTSVNSVVEEAVKYVASGKRANTDYFDKIVAKSFSNQSIKAVNVTTFFVNSNVKSRIRYSEYYKIQKQKFIKNFMNMRNDLLIIDFVNILRMFIDEYPNVNHDELIKVTCKEIYNNMNQSESYSQGLIDIRKKVDDLYADALQVIAGSRAFLMGQ